MFVEGEFCPEGEDEESKVGNEDKWEHNFYNGKII